MNKSGSRGKQLTLNLKTTQERDILNSRICIKGIKRLKFILIPSAFINTKVGRNSTSLYFIR
jgi:hypothetical protein